MYADDTTSTLYCSIDKLATNNINDVINEHLDMVNVWMNSNKLVLYSKQTNYMLFHKHDITLPNLKLCIIGHTIDQEIQFSRSAFEFTAYMAYTHLEIYNKYSRVTGLI